MNTVSEEEGDMKDRGGQVVYHAERYGPEETARFSWDGEPVTL